MKYTLLILRRAQKELAGLDSTTHQDIIDAIRALEQEPRPTGTRKLTEREGWRIRVRNYRVIYEIDDERELVTILHVGHRRDVYRE